MKTVQARVDLITHFAFLITGLAVVMSCASSRPTQKEVVATPPAPPVVAEPVRHDVVTTVTFDPGRDSLSPESSEKLRKAIEEVRRGGEINHIEIAAWSDLPYPAKKKSLPKSQVKLADHRARSVEAYINQIAPSSSIKKINMAKQPNAFQKWLETRDAQVKELLEAAGVTASQARSSSAVVLVQVK